jgi:hypothetical protein
VSRQLDAIGRRVLLRAYLRGYGRAAPLDRRRVERWMPLAALARLTAGIEGERASLLAMIERGLAEGG